MKTTFKLFISLIFAVTIFGGHIKAEEISDQELEGVLNETYDKYLKQHEAASTMELTQEQTKELAAKLHDIKMSNPTLAELENKSMVMPRAKPAFKGFIFVTGDSKTSGFRHGHAGVGASQSDAVIEANPGAGVKLYKNRISGYWAKHNSSIMGVKDMTTDKFQKAYNWANKQIGKPYKLQSGYTDKSYYCSSLVHVSWIKAGKNLTGAMGGYVLPLDLYRSRYTYTVVKYKNGY